MNDIVSLRKITVMFKKELRFFFLSPIAYIFTCIFLVVLGIYFFSRFFIIKQNNLQEFFGLMPLLLSFTIPPVTMGLFSEEFKSGSYEIISTQSVGAIEIILGKFFAAGAFMLFMLLPTVLYPITLSLIGTLDMGPVIGGYIGSFFLILSMTALGVFASSMSKNQIVSLIIGLSIMIMLNLFLRYIGLFLPQTAANIVDFFSSDLHFVNIAKGVFDLRDIVYFLSITVMALYATYLSLTERK